MKTLPLLIAIMLLTALTAPAVAQNDAAREAYNQARDLLNDREYTEAAQRFGRIVDDYPDSRYAAESLYWAAFALMREGDRRALLRAKEALEFQLENYPEEARKGDSAELALRTQQIVAEESGIANTVDPLGGSYFVEYLTDQMEAGIVAIMALTREWSDEVTRTESARTLEILRDRHGIDVGRQTTDGASEG